ncbi:hypothetical protein EZV62_008152 [Acer yangbiense]|uniref:Leucine-rich repeat-containing N-terminal plant-type domain-containing protein n=1 Tax=Acer yangbiense TaxID=1000413 RepID=A0A5C7ICD6_9ROSI|nr:hypothetical protein EZV62_008152 [Acer yangbiense]
MEGFLDFWLLLVGPCRIIFIFTVAYYMGNGDAGIDSNGLIPMTYLRWVFFAFFVCSSVGLQTQSKSCDPSDLLAPKEFARNLTNESIITPWSNNSFFCQWDGVVCGKKGVLPVVLSNLKQLQVLDLGHNLLSGLVSRVLSGLKMIQSLSVSSNSCSGDLLELGGLPNLALFNVSNNSFTGRLNSQIRSVPQIGPRFLICR